MMDFDAGWADLQKTKARLEGPARWDKRAPRYDGLDARNLYVEDFLRRAGVRAGERVLDMGCGTGMLSMALAQAGCAVVAADFSQGMLAKLRENADVHGVALCDVQDALRDGAAGCVAPVRMAWEDDWESFGICEGAFDVAIASRSVAVADLRAALRKLSAAARRRCCATLATGVSPRVDPAVLSAVGVPMDAAGRDYLYAFGMLAQAGACPEVSYIHSKRKDTFASLDDAFDDFSCMVDLGAPGLSAADREAALGRLREWLAAHVAENPEAGLPDKKGLPQGPLTLDHERTISWAFVSWDPKAAAL